MRRNPAQFPREGSLVVDKEEKAEITQDTGLKFFYGNLGVYLNISIII